MNAPRVTFVLFVLVAVSRPAFADWLPPGNDVVVHDANQSVLTAVPDLSGGAILFYSDTRNQVPFLSYAIDTYGQHVKVDGALAPGWTLDGASVFRNSSVMTLKRAIPDGQGGAFVTGYANFNANQGYGTALVFNRVTKDGPPDENGAQQMFWSEMGAGGGGLAPDGAGGLYVAGHDATAACQSEDCALKVYVGRYDETLLPHAGWPVRVAGHSGSQHDPELASDGAGGVFVLWYDERTAYPDLYVQHVLPNATKDPAWPPDGVQLGALPSWPYTRQLIPDGTGGLYAAWLDFRGGRRELYAQHLDATGAAAPGWPAGGLLAATDPGTDVSSFTFASDGGSGTLIAWNTPGETRVLRRQANGAPAPGWPAAGRLVFAGSNGNAPPSTAPGASADLFVLGYEAGTYRLWRIDGSGANVAGWPVEVPVGGPVALAPDPWGGVIASWSVNPGNQFDVRSLRVGPNGAIGSLVGAEPNAQRAAWTLGLAVPNPSRAGTSCVLSIPTPARTSARIVDVRGRVVRTLLDSAALPPGEHRLAWDGKGSGGLPAAAGIYLLDVRIDGIAQSRRIVRLGIQDP